MSEFNKSGAIDSAKNSTKSTFGLSFKRRGQFQESAYTTVGGSKKFNPKVQYQNENPQFGFNSTSQRFTYIREMQKMGETPGPGSYF